SPRSIKVIADCATFPASGCTLSGPLQVVPGLPMLHCASEIPESMPRIAIDIATDIAIDKYFARFPNFMESPQSLRYCSRSRRPHLPPWSRNRGFDDPLPGHRYKSYPQLRKPLLDTA